MGRGDRYLVPPRGHIPSQTLGTYLCGKANPKTEACPHSFVPVSFYLNMYLFSLAPVVGLIHRADNAAPLAPYYRPSSFTLGLGPTRRFAAQTVPSLILGFNCSLNEGSMSLAFVSPADLMFGDITRRQSPAPDRAVSPFPYLGNLYICEFLGKGLQSSILVPCLSTGLTTRLRSPLIIVRAHSPSGLGQLAASRLKQYPR